MVGANYPDAAQVWQYGLTPYIWPSLTGLPTSASQLAVQDGSELYMLASNGGPLQVWQYNTPYNWSPLTGTNTQASSITVAADNNLYMLAANNGAAVQSWLYEGTPYYWAVVNKIP
jgi:hypothetical protein